MAAISPARRPCNLEEASGAVRLTDLRGGIDLLSAIPRRSSYLEPVSGAGRPAVEMAYRLGPSGDSAGSRVLTICPVAKSMTWMGPR